MLPKAEKSHDITRKSLIAFCVPQIAVCSSGCPPFQDKWIQDNDHLKKKKEKEIRGVFVVAMIVDTKTFHFRQNIVLSCTEKYHFYVGAVLL